MTNRFTGSCYIWAKHGVCFYTFSLHRKWATFDQVVCCRSCCANCITPTPPPKQLLQHANPVGPRTVLLFDTSLWKLAVYRLLLRLWHHPLDIHTSVSSKEAATEDTDTHTGPSIFVGTLTSNSPLELWGPVKIASQCLKIINWNQIFVKEQNTQKIKNLFYKSDLDKMQQMKLQKTYVLT